MWARDRSPGRGTLPLPALRAARAAGNAPEVSRILPPSDNSPEKFDVGQHHPRNLPGGCKDAQGDRRIETTTLLRRVGWRQIDVDPPGRKIEAGVLNGAADAIPALLDRLFGQSDDREGGKAVGEVHLDRDFWCIDPGAGTAEKDSE